MAAILNFEFFLKNAKHKNACISKTVLDRAILVKILICRVTLLVGDPILKNNFVLPKMAAILNFRIFRKKSQNTRIFVSRKPCKIEQFCKIFDYRVSVKSSLYKFQRIFHLPKMVAILISEFFAKIVKHKNPCISKTVPDRANSSNF